MLLCRYYREDIQDKEHRIRKLIEPPQHVCMYDRNQDELCLPTNITFGSVSKIFGVDYVAYS